MWDLAIAAAHRGRDRRPHGRRVEAAAVGRGRALGDCALDVGEADGTTHAGAAQPGQVYAKLGGAAAGQGTDRVPFAKRRGGRDARWRRWHDRGRDRGQRCRRCTWTRAARQPRQHRTHRHLAAERNADLLDDAVLEDLDLDRPFLRLDDGHDVAAADLLARSDPPLDQGAGFHVRAQGRHDEVGHDDGRTSPRAAAAMVSFCGRAARSR